MAKVANRMLTIKFESEKDPSQTRTQEIEGFFRTSFVTRIDLTLGDSLLFRQKKPGAADEKLMTITGNYTIQYIRGFGNRGIPINQPED